MGPLLPNRRRRCHRTPLLLLLDPQPIIITTTTIHPQPPSASPRQSNLPFHLVALPPTHRSNVHPQRRPPPHTGPHRPLASHARPRQPRHPASLAVAILLLCAAIYPVHLRTHFLRVDCLSLVCDLLVLHIRRFAAPRLCAEQGAVDRQSHRGIAFYLSGGLVGLFCVFAALGVFGRQEEAECWCWSGAACRGCDGPGGGERAWRGDGACLVVEREDGDGPQVVYCTLTRGTRP